MLTTTTDEIPGKKIIKALGIARGSTIRARHVGRDFMANFKMLIGGEVKTYTQMMVTAREEAYQRMCEVAEEMGADAIVCVRFTSIEIHSGSAECLAYGTAVIVKE